ncbi:hypothetical protein P152DRAFT_208977 [Eremomyces bilateralis CBS 781.70]|uniref:Uncharacterized protein n=1 Tax=Eremomyces bilateralis CBS 781.70 TaxID=1392243 RepID=A0A6G1FSK7_9PEZI|nr:uncharacterized protein P152DRAFT_208977 [Eremomyces bilateralis CBS 781.70]KAF1808767.1 hypothetical protein P152DRAFT_208977 [Eremomyces bilateralis CBS 781.70]
MTWSLEKGPPSPCLVRESMILITPLPSRRIPSVRMPPPCPVCVTGRKKPKLGMAGMCSWKLQCICRELNLSDEKCFEVGTTTWSNRHEGPINNSLPSRPFASHCISRPNSPSSKSFPASSTRTGSSFSGAHVHNYLWNCASFRWKLKERRTSLQPNVEDPR